MTKTLIDLGFEQPDIIATLVSEKDANYRFRSKKKEYVAKFFPSGTNPADVDLQLRAIQLARKAGLVVPLLAGTYHSDINLVVFEFIPGTVLGEVCTFELDDEIFFWELLRSTCCVLGKLSQSLSVFPIGKPRWVKKERCEWNFFNFDIIFSQSKSSCVQWTPECQLLIEEVSERFSKLDLTDLSFQLIHYDCNLDNLILAEKKSVAIIDFGDVDLGPRIADLSIFLTYVLGQVMLRNRTVSRVDVGKIIKVAVAAFDSADPVTAKEKRAMPLLMLARAVMSVCIQSRRDDAYSRKSIIANRAIIEFAAAISLTEFLSCFNP